MKTRTFLLLISVSLSLPPLAYADPEFAYGAGNCQAQGIKVLLILNDPTGLHMKNPQARLPALAVLRSTDTTFPDGYDAAAIVGTMNEVDFQGNADTTRLKVTFSIEPKASRIHLESRDGNEPWQTTDLPATCIIKQEGGGSGGAHN